LKRDNTKTKLVNYFKGMERDEWRSVTDQSDDGKAENNLGLTGTGLKDEALKSS
jgi:hypothetical protein